VAGTAPCASCGAPLAADQRYCLECGERRGAIGSALHAPPSTETAQQPASAPPPPSPPQLAPSAPAAPRSSSVPALIAGVGVLLIAMGVGVLIGRSGNLKQAAASAPYVVTVAGAPSSGTSTAAGEATFSDDWPSGTSGYTVQLQTLPQPGTTVAAVEAAKSAATAKGAKAVGALRSEDFSSLPSGDYLIYAGVYHKRAQATKALAGLKKQFPDAKVVAVNRRSASSEASEAAAGSSGGVGENESKPAPASVLKSLSKAKGKNYEEKSKNLPDVVSTG
jgi:hypothetical protein